jgi:hypothetical protein
MITSISERRHLNENPPTIEYASPTRRVRVPSRAGRISLTLGFVALLLELLLCSGVFASDQVILPVMTVGMTALLILTAIGFGIAAAVNKAAGAGLALLLAAFNLVAFLGMVVYFLAHLPVC